MRCIARCLLSPKRVLASATPAVVPPNTPTVVPPNIVPPNSPGVSKWEYSHIEPFVNITYNPNMLLTDKTNKKLNRSKRVFVDVDIKKKLNRSERVFVDVDITTIPPDASYPTWRAEYDLHGSIDMLLKEELLAKYGAVKMKGFRIDPVTHDMQLPNGMFSMTEAIEIGKMHGDYNRRVYNEVAETFNAMAFCIGESLKTRETGGVSEGRVDWFAMNWLRLSGFTDGESNDALSVSLHVNRSFPWRGEPKIAAVADFVVQTKCGDLVLVIEDKAGYWTGNNGHIAQICGEALCSMHHNFFTNQIPNAARPTKIHAVRLYNHHAAFFTLHATAAQIDAVCHHNDPLQVPGFTKMTLESDTLDPACLVEKRATKSRTTEDYIGYSFLTKRARLKAQLRMATLRQLLM